MFVCKKAPWGRIHLRRITAVFLAFFLLFQCIFPAGALPMDEVSAPTVSAHSAILIEAQTGTVIFQKDADRRLPMASTTKIMTALVALDQMPLDTLIRVSPQAVNIEGSSVYLYADESLTLEELLYAMLLESANDAATAIAIAIGGSVEGFAALMNQKAEALGLTNTHFENPHGLDGDTHYTTARELAIIAAEVMRQPELCAIVSTRQKTISHGGDEGVRLLINHNKLLRSYEGCTGLKTGFTKKSGRCLVSSASRDGLTLIAVTLNAPDDWRDHTAMLDYGFSRYESVTVCQAGDYQAPLWVVSGTQSYAVVGNRDSLTVPLPVDRRDIHVTVELPRFEYAPIAADQQMGQLVYRLELPSGQKIEIGRVPLYATHKVEPVDYTPSFWERITSFFHIS